MANFAEIDENNIVLRVVAVHDSEEHIWPISPFNGVWVRTSYNRNIRKNYAGIGYKYDVDRDAFIPPKPYASWVLDEQTCLWVAPIPYPNNDKEYTWDEDTKTWAQV